MGEEGVPVVFSVLFVRFLVLVTLSIRDIWRYSILRARMPNFNSRVVHLTYNLLVPTFDKVVGAATFDAFIIFARNAMNFRALFAFPEFVRDSLACFAVNTSSDNEIVSSPQLTLVDVVLLAFGQLLCHLLV